MAEVDAAVPDTLEPWLTVHVGYTLHGRDAGARDRLALLTGRTVAIERAPSRHVTEVVDADLGRVAVAVVSTVTRENTSPIGADLVRRTIDVGETLWRSRFALAVHTTETVRAVEVLHTLTDRNALSVVAHRAWRAVDVRAWIGANAAEVFADFIRTAVEIVSAIADEETLVVETDLCGTAVVVQVALAERHTLSALTDLVGRTIEVSETFAVIRAASVDALKPWGAHVVLR